MVAEMLVSIVIYLTVTDNRLSNIFFLWLSVVWRKLVHPSVRSAKIRTQMPDELVPMEANISCHFNSHSTMRSCRSASFDPFLCASLYFAVSAAKNAVNACMSGEVACCVVFLLIGIVAAAILLSSAFYSLRSARSSILPARSSYSPRDHGRQQSLQVESPSVWLIVPTQLLVQSNQWLGQHRRRREHFIHWLLQTVPQNNLEPPNLVPKCTNNARRRWYQERVPDDQKQSYGCWNAWYRRMRSIWGDFRPVPWLQLFSCQIWHHFSSTITACKIVVETQAQSMPTKKRASTSTPSSSTTIPKILARLLPPHRIWRIWVSSLTTNVFPHNTLATLTIICMQKSSRLCHLLSRAALYLLTKPSEATTNTKKWFCPKRSCIYNTKSNEFCLGICPICDCCERIYHLADARNSSVLFFNERWVTDRK